MSFIFRSLLNSKGTFYFLPYYSLQAFFKEQFLYSQVLVILQSLALYEARNISNTLQVLWTRSKVHSAVSESIFIYLNKCWLRPCNSGQLFLCHNDHDNAFKKSVFFFLGKWTIFQHHNQFSCVYVQRALNGSVYGELSDVGECFCSAIQAHVYC